MSTIVAQATASGQAGVGIVRISGDKVLVIAKKFLQITPKNRYAHYGNFYDTSGAIIDKGIAIFYPNPYSYTGEDVLELHCHGSIASINSIIDTALQLGARLAAAGEFSKRAFLNGKIDLLQAEATADLIAASNKQSAKSALRSLSGEFSTTINNLVAELIKLRVFVEATIDFSDEDIESKNISYMAKTLQDINNKLTTITTNAKQGAILRDGIFVAIIGKPNAGKSSLLNALTKNDSAIVTDIAGTTRDTLQETIHLAGIPVNIIDTAGLRQSTDIIEQEGIKRTYKALDTADCVLLVFDAKQGVDVNILPKEFKNKHLLLIKNKIDLMSAKSEVEKTKYGTEVAISAKYGIGIELLIEQLLKMVGANNLGEHSILARQRHIIALKKAQKYLISAKIQVDNDIRELLAEDLRLAALALSEITGKFSSDDLLGEIFNNFCIGK